MWNNFIFILSKFLWKNISSFSSFLLKLAFFNIFDRYLATPLWAYNCLKIECLLQKMIFIAKDEYLFPMFEYLFRNYRKSFHPCCILILREVKQDCLHFLKSSNNSCYLNFGKTYVYFIHSNNILFFQSIWKRFQICTNAFLNAMDWNMKVQTWSSPLP